MGNTAETNSRMALYAMPFMMKTTPEMMLDLRDTCVRLSTLVGDQLMITRLDFHAAMTGIDFMFVLTRNITSFRASNDSLSG